MFTVAVALFVRSFVCTWPSLMGRGLQNFEKLHGFKTNSHISGTSYQNGPILFIFSNAIDKGGKAPQISDITTVNAK